jgi:hypothetical protein
LKKLHKLNSASYTTSICKPLKKALVGVDLVDYGQAGLVLTFPSSYKDSCLIVQYPEAYLLNLFWEVQKYLPQDVVNWAIQMDWDKEQQHPIPFSEILARECLQDSANEWTMNLDNLDIDLNDTVTVTPCPCCNITLQTNDPENNSVKTFGCGDSNAGKSLDMDAEMITEVLVASEATIPLSSFAESIHPPNHKQMETATSNDTSLAYNRITELMASLSKMKAQYEALCQHIQTHPTPRITNLWRPTPLPMIYKDHWRVGCKPH